MIKKPRRCMIHINIRSKRNAFVNISYWDRQGQTLAKFSCPKIIKPTWKKQAIYLISRIKKLIGRNFNQIDIVAKYTAVNPILLKEFLRKRRKIYRKIIAYKIIVPVPHNGCRPPKKRRL